MSNTTTERRRPRRFFLDDQRLEVPDTAVSLDELRALASPPVPPDRMVWRDVGGDRDVRLDGDDPIKIGPGDVLYTEGTDGARPRKLKIVINDQVVAAPAVSMTGTQIRRLTDPPTPERDRLFRDIDGSRDEAIDDEEVVTVAFGAEFYTRRRFYIVVNGREKTRRDLDDRDLTFDEVIELAFDNPPSGPQVMFSVSYRNGPPNRPSGTLVAGESVRARTGMVFNVTATDKS